MSVIVNKLFLDARALLNTYSEDGVLIADADVIDLQLKFVRFADMAQKELYKSGRLYKTFEYANTPAPNLLGDYSNFDIVDFIGEVQYYPASGGVYGAKSYYFEADGEGTVTIEENRNGVWTTIKTINISSTVTSLTPFKGSISPLSNSNQIRMKFNGTTHYRHVNRCLYSYPFSESKIPAYRPWIKIQMPSDFKSIDQIIEEYPVMQYSVNPNHKWEGFKDLYINYGYAGNIRIIYKPVPKTIASINDILEIDDITAEAITYYCAARLAPFKKKELVQFFEDKYNELKFESKTNNVNCSTEIVDVY